MALMADACTTKDKPFFDKHRPKAPTPETPTKRHEEIEPIEPNEGTRPRVWGMFQVRSMKKGPKRLFKLYGG